MTAKEHYLEEHPELDAIHTAAYLEWLEEQHVIPKEAYEAGQASMQCGCYEPEDCTSYEEWVRTPSL